MLALLLRATPARRSRGWKRTASRTRAYSAARLAQLRAAHRPVFINATAAWCITCLVNERVAFSSGVVARRLRQASRRVPDRRLDPARSGITKLLEAHGRDGVPLYLYYAPGAADAAVLPQILTEGEVLKVVGASSS